MASKKSQHNRKFKSKDYDEYSTYSDDNFGSYSQETEEDFASQLKQYRQAKETSNTSLGSSFFLSLPQDNKLKLKPSPRLKANIFLNFIFSLLDILNT